jgi:NhaP-type Na+/H+ or K+/H+ antiporter
VAWAGGVAAGGGAVGGFRACMALGLGGLRASTDPVAVSALGRRLSLPPKVQALVQAESLFNDATSLVLFQIAVSFSQPTRQRLQRGLDLEAARLTDEQH